MNIYFRFDFFKIWLLTCCIFLNIQVYSQQNPPQLISVSGIILNEQNQAVPATVTIKGTKTAVATNIHGEFILSQAGTNAVLVISGVSVVTTEVPVNGRSNLATIRVLTKIGLQEAVQVEASTGYQSVKPNEINGSVVLIDNKTLNQQASSNILKRLDGVTSGLLFNIGKSNGNSQNTTAISIRGLSTINGPLDPLVVLDGFIYEGNINNINPNDVENITVLKDAAAASVWGSRAGNGVIVITTKKGRLNHKMVISVAANRIITEKPDLYQLPQMSSADYINVEQFLFNKGFFNSRINRKYRSLTPAVEVFLKRRKNFITAADSASQINALKGVDSRDQYDQYVYRPGVTQQYAINLRGGTNNNAYTLSSGYDKNISNLRAEYNKLNINIENIFQPVKQLQLDMGVYYTNSHSLTGIGGYRTLRPGERYVTYFKLADDNGTALPVATLYNSAYTDTLAGGKLFDWKFYPLEDYKHDRTRDDLQEIYSRLGVNYVISKSLNIDLKYQYQTQLTQSERLADIESYAARDVINSFSQPDPSTGVISYIVPPGGIRSLSKASVESQTLRGQLNFKKSWAVHSFNAIMGVEQRQVKAKNDAYTVYGYNADPLTNAATDFVNSYPQILPGGYNGIGGQPSSGQTLYRFTSIYSNAAYTLKNRYSISASARRDGSNIFGANANDRWKPLWSLGAGWKISAENFYKNRLINYLKLKVSYGHSGNVDLSKTAQPIAYFIGNDNLTNLPFSQIGQLNNPDLRWEQSRQFNMGVDFSFVKNIFSGSVDLYSKEGKDLYGAALFDYTASGIDNVIIKNVANTKGRGIDLILNSKIFDKKFKWLTGLLFSYNKTITKKYFSANANQAHILTGGGNTIIPVVGKDLYGIVAYKWGGLNAQGNPQGYLNGVLSTDYIGIANQVGKTELESGSIVYIGSGTPHYFGSFINTFSWKQFSLAINIAGKFDYYFFKPTINYNSLINGGLGHKDFAKRWQKPGDELTTDVPAFIYPENFRRGLFYQLSTVNVLKGGNIRVQYINFSYTPLLKFTRKNSFNGLELYANVSNLGILWRANKEKVDPDYPTGTAPGRNWAFGIRGNF